MYLPQASHGPHVYHHPGFTRWRSAAHVCCFLQPRIMSSMRAFTCLIVLPTYSSACFTVPCSPAWSCMRAEGRVTTGRATYTNSSSPAHRMLLTSHSLCSPHLSLQPRMESCMRAEGRVTTGRVTYAGRPPSASPSTGYAEVHAQEQARLIEEALNLEYNMPW